MAGNRKLPFGYRMERGKITEHLVEAEAVREIFRRCQSRASFLGAQNPMKNLEWTERELEILKEHYPSMSRGVVALLPGRTETACKSMAAKLNLVTSVRKRPVGKKWTEEEIKILRTLNT